MTNKTPTSKAQPPVSWISTPEKGGQEDDNSETNQLDDYEWNSKFPIIICANEWNVERSNPLSLVRKKKTSCIRIELRRNPKHGLNLKGYKDLESGSSSSALDWEDLIEPGDAIVFHILKQSYSNIRASTSVSSDDESVSTIGLRAVDDFKRGPSKVKNDGSQWQVKLSVPLYAVSLKREKAKCLVEFSMGNMKKTVLLHFKDENESTSFALFVKNLQNIMLEVGSKAISKDRRTISPSSSSTNVNLLPIKFLVEIVSATDLKGKDNQGTSSDPYVNVYYAGEKIHSTYVIEKTLDPIWTLDTKSTFVFSLRPEEYYMHDLVFEIRDKDSIGYDFLGKAVVSNSELAKSNGERIELKLKDRDIVSDCQGYLAVKCKRAKEHDLEFLNSLENTTNITKEAFDDYCKPNVHKQPLLPGQCKKIIRGVEHYLARPVQEEIGKLWLTSEEIEKASLEESRLWAEVGSGRAGKVFVEILSCNKLPNMDLKSMIPNDQTDTFVTCICEDSVGVTDVVKNCKHPRFMPWSKRAFQFNIEHPRSLLYIGVHDYDVGPKMHDAIGRVIINPTKFLSGTTYNLNYDLYDSHQTSYRKKVGKVKVRLRVEWSSERTPFFDTFGKKEWNHSIHVNAKKNYKHIQYTVNGKPNLNEYSLKTFFGLIEELLKYQLVYFDFLEGIKTVLFWRSHTKFIGINIPLHSMIFFSFTIVLIEYPMYSMSVAFASIAWLMLALLEMQRKDPSPWNRPPSYFTLMRTFLTGNAQTIDIDANHNNEATARHVKMKKREHIERENMTEQFWETFYSDGELMEQLTADNDKVFEKTQKAGRLPFREVLHPIQKTIVYIIMQLRLLSRICSWDLVHVSFWITTAAIILSIASLFVGDTFLLWTKRVFLYGISGPQNKILDIIFFRYYDNLSDAEKEDLKEERAKKRRDRFHGHFSDVQKRKEERVKEEALKNVLFGQRVVVIHDMYQPERFQSVPNNDSSARPYKNNEAPTPLLSFRGQR